MFRVCGFGWLGLRVLRFLVASGCQSSRRFVLRAVRRSLIFTLLLPPLLFSSDMVEGGWPHEVFERQVVAATRDRSGSYPIAHLETEAGHLSTLNPEDPLNPKSQTSKRKPNKTLTKTPKSSSPWPPGQGDDFDPASPGHRIQFRV